MYHLALAHKRFSVCALISIYFLIVSNQHQEHTSQFKANKQTVICKETSQGIQRCYYGKGEMGFELGLWAE